MSDQDFFFDDEEVEESPKGGPKKPSKGGSTTPPVKPAKPVIAAPATEGVSFFEQAVPMQVVALVAVIALLLGVIGGFFLAPKPVSAPITTTLPATGTSTGTMGTGGAPSLTEDQLNTGELPSGHPDVSGDATEATTTP